MLTSTRLPAGAALAAGLKASKLRDRSSQRVFLRLTGTAACWRCAFYADALRRDQHSRWGDASSPTLFDASFNVKVGSRPWPKAPCSVAPYCGSNVRGRVKVPLRPNHPVCLQVFGRIGYYECRITGTMRRLGIRTRSTMRAQSVCRECATNGVAPETVSRALLTGVGQAGSRRLYTATAAADLD